MHSTVMLSSRSVASLRYLKVYDSAPDSVGRYHEECGPLWQMVMLQGNRRILRGYDGQPVTPLLYRDRLLSHRSAHTQLLYPAGKYIEQFSFISRMIGVPALIR